MSIRSASEVWPELIAMLVKQPRTLGELSEVTGSRFERVSAKVKALHAEGLVYIAEWRRASGSGAGPLAAVWAWQPSVLHYSDAQKPVIARSHAAKEMPHV